MLSALSSAREATYVWTPRTDRLDWVDSPSRTLKAPTFGDPISGKLWRGAMSVGDMTARDAWVSCDRQSSAFTGIYRVGAEEHGLWIEERIVRLCDTECGDQRYLGRLRNVSVERQRMEKLSFLARFDELTGHLSRAHLRSLLAQRMETASSEGTSISFGLVGLDNLSGFNSMFGYDVADVVLVKIGDEILRQLGPRDAVGRVGSSKFAIIFADCPKTDLKARLGRIQAAIRDTVIETGAGPVAVTVSAAGLSLPQDATTTHDAFAIAEDTLNHAKDYGLDQVVIYTANETVSAERRDNIALADDMVAALRENRLRLAYQPVVQAQDPSQVAFHECLLRLLDRSGELITAGAFMPVAEKLGLVRMLDRRVLELVFETLRRNTRVRLSVNISPQSLRDKRWQNLFEELATAHPHALERLILEVTEATVIDDAEAAAEMLNRFRDMGCSIALDDFGAGYTSFQQLRDMTFDIVKIDGSYVRNILDNPGDQVFVEALAGIAKHHDLLIVAEMVDSDEAGALLHSLGVDTFQGFHFGRPDVAPDWLGRDEAEMIAQAVAVRSA